jgi:hypothetical protein
MASDLLDRLPLWEREAARHEAKAKALRQMIDAVRVLNGDAARLFLLDADAPLLASPDSPPQGTPRGRGAIRLIVAERPGEWRASEVKRELALRGWPHSPNAVDTALQRMHGTGEAERVSKGVYRFGTRSEASAPVTGDASEHRATGSPELL